jgi:hypothetical protein
MAWTNDRILEYWLAHGASPYSEFNPEETRHTFINYPDIIAQAISNGKDPVHAMNKWYRVTVAYGGRPKPPPTITFDQINNLRQYAAESNCTMSDLFYAVLTELRKGNCPLAGETVANMEKGLRKKPPTSPTINVYTKDNVIHNVPANKLTEMGPETLASVVAITDEMPWSESRVADFKKQQGKRLEEVAAKKKAALEAARARALDVGEDLWSPTAQTFARVAKYSYEGDTHWHVLTRLSAIVNAISDERYYAISEELHDGTHVQWPSVKVCKLNEKRATKNAESKKAKRKEQIDELVSKLLKERNEL